MTEFAVEEQGAKGLAWTKIDENNMPQGELQNSLQKIY